MDASPFGLVVPAALASELGVVFFHLLRKLSLGAELAFGPCGQAYNTPPLRVFMAALLYTTSAVASFSTSFSPHFGD